MTRAFIKEKRRVREAYELAVQEKEREKLMS